MTLPIILAFLVALFTTFIICPFVIKLAIHMKLIDDPKVRYHPANTHKGAIPRAGGLSLFIGITIAILLFLPINIHTIGIMIGALILTIVGLLDDKKDINPYVRLIINILVAIIVVFSGNIIPFITNPFSGGILNLSQWAYTTTMWGTPFSFGISQILAILWIVWTMNIVGWSAGVDGQMPGYVSISAFVLGLLSLRYSISDPSQLWITLLAFIVSGAFLGFLPWNFYPQKIMPGYGGKTLAGFFLALLGILSYAKVGTAILVLGIPMMDAIFTLIRRISAKKSPVRADRGHLHHKLLDLGWGKRRIALFYWCVSAILGLVSLIVTSKLKVFTFIIVAVTLAMFLVWVSYFTQFSKRQGRDNG